MYLWGESSAEWQKPLPQPFASSRGHAVWLHVLQTTPEDMAIMGAQNPEAWPKTQREPNRESRNLAH